MNHLKTILVSGIGLLLLAGCSMEQPSETSDAETPSGDVEPLEFRTQYEDIRVSKVVSGLERPWGVAFLPDGRKLITEKPGRLQLFEDGELSEISGIPEVSAVNQGGLLDVVLHPDYEENGWIYLTYSQAEGVEGNTATTLVRGRLDGNNIVDLEEIFVQNRYSSPGRHYGSRVAFDSDGYLYMSVGDRGTEPLRAQDPGDHAGSLLRMHDDGSVPDDNPFVDHPDAAPEIYSYGHRNIQGLVIDPENNKIWATEHGPRGGDELNLVEAGNNYGWPTASLGRSYGNEREFHEGTEARRVEGMVDPVYELLPTHSPSGLALVTSDQFPAWEGNLLAGGLRGQRIRRLVIENDEVIHEEELLPFEIGRIRDVREGPDGNIYVLTDDDPGALYKIEPND